MARHHPERLKIAKETGLEKDWFRERGRQEEENETAAVQALINHEAASRAVREREQWHNRWLEWAFENLPWGVPDEYRLDVRQEVDKILQSLHPHTPEPLTRKLVEGAVQQGLTPCRSAQYTEKALGNALSTLPGRATSLGKPTRWQIRAREEANSAISKLPDGASFEAKLAAATAAVQKITQEFEEETLRQKIIDESISLPLLSSAEKEDAKAAIRTSVESSRPGSGEAELRRERQTALKPFEETQRQREDRQRLERKVGQRLDHIRTFLDELWEDDELEGFENRFEVWSYANEIREDVRAELLEGLEGRPEVSDHKIEAMIEAIVDDLLSG